jgi:predicted molibdopterin-dependent oxidoreductase YjgC
MCRSASRALFAEYAGLPQTPGKTMSEMFAAAARGELGALLVVGANPVARWPLIRRR